MNEKPLGCPDLGVFIIEKKSVMSENLKFVKFRIGWHIKRKQDE